MSFLKNCWDRWLFTNTHSFMLILSWSVVDTHVTLVWGVQFLRTCVCNVKINPVEGKIVRWGHGESQTTCKNIPVIKGRLRFVITRREREIHYLWDLHFQYKINHPVGQCDLDRTFMCNLLIKLTVFLVGELAEEMFVWKNHCLFVLTGSPTSNTCPSWSSRTLVL